MLPDDVFRSRLNATIEALRYWVPTVSDAASIHESEGGTFWKLTAVPHAGACPFELVLRLDQHHDLIVAGEVYEDRPTHSLELFVPLATAISEGNVLQRRWITCATETLCAVETIIRLEDGTEWHGSRIVDTIAAPDSDATMHRDRKFLPYRRA